MNKENGVSQRKKAQFSAKLALLPEVLAWITEGLSLSTSLRRQIELAAEEVFVNIFTHAYREEAKLIEIERQVTPQGDLQISFKDQGPPFDPTQHSFLPAPTLDEAKPGGLGLHLIRQSVDEVHYQRTAGHNILTLKKKLL